MRVMTVVGTRPELIRLSLIFRAFETVGCEHVLVHTGQNHDPRLSQIFFDELELPEPDVHLGVRAATVGAQIGQIVAGAEAAVLEHRPEALLILGDTDSGLSAIAAARHRVPIFHMEAGNRCFDWRVPEERNRRLIDHISDWLLPYTPRSREHLLAEGVRESRVFVCGNPIVDVLERHRARWEGSDVLARLGIEPDRYVLVTAHRQETVDFPARLEALCAGLSAVAETLQLPLIWSVHPRTRSRLAGAGVALHPLVAEHEPFSFCEFAALEAQARLVITDSGTVQEECSLLMTPAVTCRDSTERPETLECGCNVLCGVQDPWRMVACAQAMLDSRRDWTSPYAADRGVAERVVAFIAGHAGAGLAGAG
jgi:UDP-N-acetylglucosamine 2-epimerase